MTWTKTHERSGLDLHARRPFVRPLYRGSDLVARALHGRVLRRGRARAPRGQRHGDGGGLDVGRLVHLHGGTHLLHGPRRLGIPHGLDRRLRAAGAPLGALPPQVRQVHRTRLRRRPLLLQGSPRGRGGLRPVRVVHLCRRTDAGRGHRVLPLSQRRHQPRCFHRYGDRVLLCRVGRHEGHHLHPGRAILRADLRLPGTGRLHLAAGDRRRHSPVGLWVYPGRRFGRLPAGQTQRLESGVGVRRLHQWAQEHPRRLLHYLGADGGNGRPTPRNCEVLHGTQGGRRPKFRRLGAGFHRPPVHHGSGGGGLCPHQHPRHHRRSTVPGDAVVVHQLGSDRADPVRRPERRRAGPVPRTQRGAGQRGPDRSRYHCLGQPRDRQAAQLGRGARSGRWIGGSTVHCGGPAVGHLHLDRPRSPQAHHQARYQREG